MDIKCAITLALFGGQVSLVSLSEARVVKRIPRCPLWGAKMRAQSEKKLHKQI